MSSHVCLAVGERGLQYQDWRIWLCEHEGREPHDDSGIHHFYYLPHPPLSPLVFVLFFISSSSSFAFLLDNNTRM